MEGYGGAGATVRADSSMDIFGQGGRAGGRGGRGWGRRGAGHIRTLPRNETRAGVGEEPPSANRPQTGPSAGVDTVFHTLLDQHHPQGGPRTAQLPPA